MNEPTIKLSKKLQDIAKNLENEIAEAAGEKIAFTLVIFTEGRSQYVSTCDRKSSLDAMEEMMSYWRQGIPDIKAHEVSS